MIAPSPQPRPHMTPLVVIGFASAVLAAMVNWYAVTAAAVLFADAS